MTTYFYHYRKLKTIFEIQQIKLSVKNQFESELAIWNVP